jgi:hypothetical protein
MTVNYHGMCFKKLAPGLPLFWPTLICYFSFSKFTTIIRQGSFANIRLDKHTVLKWPLQIKVPGVNVRNLLFFFVNDEEAK